MNQNPYKPPESKLVNEDDNEFKRSIWWKIYFYVFTVIYVLTSLAFIIEPRAGIAEINSLFIMIVSTIGFFGFIYLKPIYKPKFWQIIFLLSLVDGFLWTYITNIDMRNGMTELEYYLNSAIGWFISLPAFYALYAYSRETNPIWRKLSAKKFKAF